MKRLNFIIKVFSLTIFLTGSGFLFNAHPVSALPIFAKKYNLPCTACHEAFPKLNDFGIAFRDNGYQLGTERDTPQENMVISPLSLRTTPIFTVTTSTAFSTDQNSSESLSTGTFDLTGLDILSAGVLAKNISYELVITPFLNNNVDLESAWIRFSNLFDNSWINIKLGKHELDIPFSEKRAFGLSNLGGAYLVNHYHPGGIANSNGFEAGNNQYGIELLGHDKESRIRYVIDLNNGSNPTSNQAVAKRPNLFTHFSLGLDQELSSERFGLLADFGRWPTSAKTVGGSTLPGTGENTVPYTRFGADLALSLAYSGASRLSLAVQYLYGIDDGRLICPSALSSTPVPCPTYLTPSGTGVAGSQDAVFHGGTVEINWMPGLNSLVFGHYDLVVNKQQADPAMPADYNNQTGLTFGIRYYIHISEANLVALHGEWAQLTTKKTNLVTGEDQTTNDYLVGVDYAF